VAAVVTTLATWRLLWPCLGRQREVVVVVEEEEKVVVVGKRWW
jgi:hypothetical protein